MMDIDNLELVNNKLKTEHAEFANYERAHIAYTDCLDDPEQIQRATQDCWS